MTAQHILETRANIKTCQRYGALVIKQEAKAFWADLQVRYERQLMELINQQK